MRAITALKWKYVRVAVGLVLITLTFRVVMGPHSKSSRSVSPRSNNESTIGAQRSVTFDEDKIVKTLDENDSVVAEKVIRDFFKALYESAQTPPGEATPNTLVSTQMQDLATPQAIAQIRSSAASILKPWLSREFKIENITNSGLVFRVMVNQSFDYGSALKPSIFTYNVQIEKFASGYKITAGNLQRDGD